VTPTTSPALAPEVKPATLPFGSWVAWLVSSWVAVELLLETLLDVEVVPVSEVDESD